MPRSSPAPLNRIPPGEILAEEFLVPLGVTQYRLARDIGVDPRRVNAIVLGKRAITADTALRLARYFGTTPQFWLNLQAHYDLELAQAEVGEAITRSVSPLQRAS
jgi:addiction module HigA family antidote